MHWQTAYRGRERCAEPQCPTTASKLGYCRRHERRALEKLDADHMNEVLADIASHLAVDTETGCWLYDSINESGYAVVNAGGYSWLGHRLMFVWFFGGHSPRREFDHVCVNANCLRPNHLHRVTPKQNKVLRDKRGRFPDLPFWTDDYLCPRQPQN